MSAGNKGGETRQIIELDKVVEFAVERLTEIESTDATTARYNQLNERLAASIKSKLYYDKRKSSQVSERSFKSYMTRVRRELIALGFKSRQLPSTVLKLVELMPQFKTELLSIRDLPLAESQKVYKDLKESDAMREYRRPMQNHLNYEAFKALRIDADVMYMLSLGDAIKDEAKLKSAESLEHKNNHSIYVSVEEIIEHINELFTLNNYSSLALGVALATGRRAIEILYQGNFENLDAPDNHKLNFSGQAKKKALDESRLESFEIYTLVDSSKVLRAVNKLRNLETIKRLGDDFGKFTESNRNIAINSRTAKTLNEKIRRAFNDETKVFKDSRAIYAAIATNLFLKEDEATNIDVFLRKLMGHSDKDLDSIKHYKFVKVCEHNELKTKTRKMVKQVQNVEAVEAVEATESDLTQLQSRKLKRVEKLAAKDIIQKRKPYRALAEGIIEELKVNPKKEFSQKWLTENVGCSRPAIKDFLIILFDNHIQALPENLVEEYAKRKANK